LFGEDLNYYFFVLLTLVLDFIGIAIYSYDGKAEFLASLDASL